MLPLTKIYLPLPPGHCQNAAKKGSCFSSRNREWTKLRLLTCSEALLTCADNSSDKLLPLRFISTAPARKAMDLCNCLTNDASRQSRNILCFSFVHPVYSSWSQNVKYASVIILILIFWQVSGKEACQFQFWAFLFWSASSTQLKNKIAAGGLRILKNV